MKQNDSGFSWICIYTYVLHMVQLDILFLLVHIVFSIPPLLPPYFIPNRVYYRTNCLCAPRWHEGNLDVVPIVTLEFAHPVNCSSCTTITTYQFPRALSAFSSRMYYTSIASIAMNFEKYSRVSVWTWKGYTIRSAQWSQISRQIRTIRARWNWISLSVDRMTLPLVGNFTKVSTESLLTHDISRKEWRSFPTKLQNAGYC